MLKVGDKVHVSNPKTQTAEWRETDGVVAQILDGNNSFLGTEVKIHIIQKDGGATCPVEECFLTKL